MQNRDSIQFLFSFKDTFSADSLHWTKDSVYNVENGLKSFENEEGKFAGFNSMKLQSICMGIQVKGVTKWIKTAVPSTSLLEIFKKGTYQPTSFGRNTWINLISGSYLQPHCNREGFNVNIGMIYARIGIMGNNENDCRSPDSFIGFGTNYLQWCTYKQLAKISCGNYATCSRYVSIPAKGYILVK